MKKIKKLENELSKVNTCLYYGHTFYNGKPIMQVIAQLEFEIRTRQQYGNKAREAFLK